MNAKVSGQVDSRAALLEYEGDSVPDPEELRQAVDDIWLAAKKEGSLRIGSIPIELPDHAPFRFEVTQGADAASVSLLIMAGTAGIGLGKAVLLDIWREIVLPRLKRRFGSGLRARRRSR